MSGLRRVRKLNLAVLFATTPLLFACGKIGESSLLGVSLRTTPTANPRYLYVASGTCYGGGVTTSTASNTIVRYNLSTGALDSVVADYTLSSPDSPAGIANYDADNLIVAIENGGTSRRVELVNKRGVGRNTYLTNATAMSGVLRSIAYSSDGGVLVSKTTAIEKFSSGRARVTVGANPYINAPAGNCAASATTISKVIELPGGAIAYAHGAAATNRIGIISSNGYNVVGDCLITPAVTGFATTALPTGLAYTSSSGKLLVSYSSTTLTSNAIYAYDINTTTNAVTGATAAYTNTSVVNGPTEIIEDPYDGSIYVAMGSNTFNSIEKFSFNPTTKILTRVGTTPFIGANVYTRCVSGMAVSY